MARWKFPKRHLANKKCPYSDKTIFQYEIILDIIIGVNARLKLTIHHNENVFFISLPSEGCVKKHNKKNHITPFFHTTESE